MRFAVRILDLDINSHLRPDFIFGQYSFEFPPGLGDLKSEYKYNVPGGVETFGGEMCDPHFRY